MAGPSKRKAHGDKKPDSSSGGSSAASQGAATRSTPRSIGRVDGNRDPEVYQPPEAYSVANDLKNLSEFLSTKGWYTARGVSSIPPCSPYALPFTTRPTLHNTALPFTLLRCLYNT